MKSDVKQLRDLLAESDTPNGAILSTRIATESRDGHVTVMLRPEDLALSYADARERFLLQIWAMIQHVARGQAPDNG